MRNGSAALPTSCKPTPHDIDAGIRIDAYRVSATQQARPGVWQALNPPIYLISVLPALGVLLLTGFAWPIAAPLLVATLAVILLQHGINLLNDVSDWALGADVDKANSWVRFHRLRSGIVERHGRLSLLAGALLGMALLALTGQLWIAVIASPLVALGYLYNAGKRPLSYTRLGEWVTGLCYGPGVFGCLWLLTGQPIDSAAVAGMLAFAALAMALLLSHQPPQIETDRAAGKLSFAVRHGAAATHRSAQALMLLFVAAFAYSLSLHSDSLAIPISFALIAIILTRLTPISSPASPASILRAASLALLAEVGFQLLFPALRYHLSVLWQ